MKCSAEYWIWLQRALGAGAKTDDILMFFENPRALYEAGRSEWMSSGVISAKTAERLSGHNPSESDNIIRTCKDNGWSIVTFDDERYPALLREIYGYPLVLYVWGDVSALNPEIAISMVGTRNASDYGMRVAENLAWELAKAGVVVVSGGAMGIDSASHAGAIKAGGKTVAFLGCGLGNSYLKSNEDLRKSISENGAVVSEYMPFSPPTKQTFPIRNRLISGMSLGTVIVEAGVKSGSLITARCALDQGRDVFAVPGNVMGNSTVGTNNLIRDGAKPVFSSMDVLDSYVYDHSDILKYNVAYTPLNAAGKKIENQSDTKRELNKKASTGGNKKKTTNRAENVEKAEDVSISNGAVVEEEKIIQLPEYASDTAKTIFAALTYDPVTVDELVMKAEMPVSDVLSALTELEIYKIIQMHSGKRYAIVH